MSPPATAVLNIAASSWNFFTAAANSSGFCQISGLAFDFSVMEPSGKSAGICFALFAMMSALVATAGQLPAFALSWTFFQAATQLSAASIVANANLIRSVRFPREVIPTSVVLAQAVASLVMFGVLVPAALILVPAVGVSMLLAIPMFVAFLCLALGIGWLVSTATVFFRDVEHLVGVLFLPWFFLTPILYPLETVERVRPLALLVSANPMTPFVRLHQELVFFGRVPAPATWLQAAGLALLAWGIGTWLFERLSQTLVEAV